MKVSKGAKIRNRYNQVPHLTHETCISWLYSLVFGLLIISFLKYDLTLTLLHFSCSSSKTVNGAGSEKTLFLCAITVVYQWRDDGTRNLSKPNRPFVSQYRYGMLKTLTRFICQFYKLYTRGEKLRNTLAKTRVYFRLKFSYILKMSYQLFLN